MGPAYHVSAARILYSAAVRQRWLRAGRAICEGHTHAALARTHKTRYDMVYLMHCVSIFVPLNTCEFGYNTAYLLIHAQDLLCNHAQSHCLMSHIYTLLRTTPATRSRPYVRGQQLCTLMQANCGKWIMTKVPALSRVAGSASTTVILLVMVCDGFGMTSDSCNVILRCIRCGPIRVCSCCS